MVLLSLGFLYYSFHQFYLTSYFLNWFRLLYGPLGRAKCTKLKSTFLFYSAPTTTRIPGGDVSEACQESPGGARNS